MPNVHFFLMPSEQKEFVWELLHRFPAVALVCLEGKGAARTEPGGRCPALVLREMALQEYQGWDHRGVPPYGRQFRYLWLWNRELAPGVGPLPITGPSAYAFRQAASGYIEFWPCVLGTTTAGEEMLEGRIAINRRSDYARPGYAGYEGLRAFVEEIRKLLAGWFRKDVECWLEWTEYDSIRKERLPWRGKLVREPRCRVSHGTWDAWSDGLRLRLGTQDLLVQLRAKTRR